MPILQPEMRVELPHQPRLELRERDARRRDVQVRDVDAGTMTSSSRASGSAITSYMLRVDLPHVEERHRAVGLGIEIDEQRLSGPAGPGRPRG